MNVATANIPAPIRAAGGAYEPTVVVRMYAPMGLRFAKPHEKQSRVAQTCRSLACLRPCREGAYIPPKYGGTYAPPWFFDPAPALSACTIRRLLPPAAQRLIELHQALVLAVARLRQREFRVEQ